MNNIELENKIKEIIAIDNYFDKELAIQSFEKEYKGSDFFKITKKSLKEIVREYQINNLLSIKELSRKVQNFINQIDFEDINDELNRIADVFEKENKNTENTITLLKNILK